MQPAASPPIAHAASKPVLVIAGPTASGKSGLALAVAEDFGGTVINADSMQVYGELRIVTARPSAEDEARVPHRLYGILSAGMRCSAGTWAGMAVAEIRAAWAAGRLPIVTGGTGLYIKALIEGLNAIPEIAVTHRDTAVALHRELGGEAFRAALAEIDPKAALRIIASDTQRLTRAYEVWLATGRSLSSWQAEAVVPPVPEARFFTLVLDPPREALYAACDGRFVSMMAAGALEEVRALKSLGLDPALPAMKALGVPELLRHLEGGLSREAAVTNAQAATRHFAKRQATWNRTQMPTAERVAEQFSESLPDRIFPKIREFLLTTQN